MTQPTYQPPTHAAGCPCDGCNAERASLAAAVAVLRANGEIPPEVLDVD